MTVSQLIEKLGEFPPEREVIVPLYSDYTTDLEIREMEVLMQKHGVAIWYYPNQHKVRPDNVKKVVSIV